MKKKGIYGKISLGHKLKHKPLLYALWYSTFLKIQSYVFYSKSMNAANKPIICVEQP